MCKAAMEIIISFLEALVNYLLTLTFGIAIASFIPNLKDYQGEVLLLLFLFLSVNIIITLKKKQTRSEK